MKVAQNDETNLETQPVHPPHIPNLSNSQLSPSGSSARKHGTPGILPGCFPPSPVSPHTALEHVLLCLLSCYALACYVFTVSPPSSLRSRTGQQQRRSRSLPERRGGRNSKYNANISMTMYDKTMSGVRCAQTRY